jgi:hypothetical protein
MSLSFKSLLLGALATISGLIVFVIATPTLRKEFHSPVSLSISVGVLWVIIVFFLLASAISFFILRTR